MNQRANCPWNARFHKKLAIHPPNYTWSRGNLISLVRISSRGKFVKRKKKMRPYPFCSLPKEKTRSTYRGCWCRERRRQPRWPSPWCPGCSQSRMPRLQLPPSPHRSRICWRQSTGNHRRYLKNTIQSSLNRMLGRTLSWDFSLEIIIHGQERGNNESLVSHRES